MFKTRGDDGRYDDEKEPEQSISSMDAKGNSQTSMTYDYKEESLPTITIRFPEEHPSPKTSQTSRTFTWRDLFPPLRTTRNYEVTEITRSIQPQIPRDLDENAFKFVNWSAVTVVNNQPTVPTSKIGAVSPASRSKSVEQTTVANTAVLKDYSLISSFKPTYRTLTKRKLKITVPEKMPPELFPWKSRRRFQPYISDLTYSERSSVHISNSSSDSVYRYVTSAKKISSRKKAHPKFSDTVRNDEITFFRPDIPMRSSKRAKSNFNISNFTSTSDNINAHDFEFVHFGKSTETYSEFPTLVPERYVPTRDHHASDDSLKSSSIVDNLKPVASRLVSSDIHPDSSLFSIPNPSSRDFSPLSYLGNISELPKLSTRGGSDVSDETLYLSKTSSNPLAKKYSGDITKYTLNEVDSDYVSLEVYYYTDDYSLNKTNFVTKIEEVAKTEASDTSTISVHPISKWKRHTPYTQEPITSLLPVPTSFNFGDYFVFPFSRVVIRAVDDYSTTTTTRFRHSRTQNKDNLIASIIDSIMKGNRTRDPNTIRYGFELTIYKPTTESTLVITTTTETTTETTTYQEVGWTTPRRRPPPRKTTRRTLPTPATIYPDGQLTTKFKKIINYDKYTKPYLIRTTNSGPRNTDPRLAKWKCYQCGLDDSSYGSAECGAAFDGINQQFNYKRAEYQIHCPDTYRYQSNLIDRGCFKRYLDLGAYEERGCRDFPPVLVRVQTRRYTRSSHHCYSTEPCEKEHCETFHNEMSTLRSHNAPHWIIDSDIAQCQFLSRRKNPNEYLDNEKRISPPDVRMFNTRGDVSRYDDEKEPEQSVSSMDAKGNSQTSIMYDYKEEPWPTITIRFPEETPSPTTSQTRRTFTWRDLFPPLRSTRKYEVTETTRSIQPQTTRDLDENTFNFVDWSAVTAVSNQPIGPTSKIGAVSPASRSKSVEQSTAASTAVLEDYSLISSFKQTYRTTTKRKLKTTHVPEKSPPVLFPLKSRKVFQPYISTLTNLFNISNSSSDSVYRYVTSTKKTSSRKKDIPTRTSKSARSNFNISNFTSTSDDVNVTTNDFELVNIGKSTKTYPEYPTLVPEYYVPRRDHDLSDDSLKLSSIVNVLKPVASSRVSSDTYPDTSLVFSFPIQSSRDLSPLFYLGNISELPHSTRGGSEVSDDTLYLSKTSSYPLAKKYAGDVNKDSLNEPMLDDSDDVNFEVYYYTDDYSLNKTNVVTKIEAVAKTEALDTNTISSHPISILKRNTPYIMNGMFFDEPTLLVPSSYMYGDYVVFPFTRVVISSTAQDEYFNSDFNIENTTSTQVSLMTWPPMLKKEENGSVVVTLFPTNTSSKTSTKSFPGFYLLKNKGTAHGLGRQSASASEGQFQRPGYPKGVMARRPVFSRERTRRPKFTRGGIHRPLDSVHIGRDHKNIYFPSFPTRDHKNIYFPSLPARAGNNTSTPEPKQKKIYAIDSKNTTHDTKNWICYECGLDEPEYSSPGCNDIFEPPNQQGKGYKRPFRTHCAHKYKFIEGFSGCFKRYLDIGETYAERGCRNWPPTAGKSFMSQKFKRLEYLLKRAADGCITSPHAILVPFSRTVQLYARVHVCVCSQKFCNRANIYSHGFYLPVSLSIFVLLTI